MSLKGIFIDAGHGLGPTGAIDNGASGNGTTERKEVVEIARETIQLLASDSSLQEAEIVPVGVEERLSVSGKTAFINARCQERGWTRDETLLVSIHLNSAGSPDARGLEAWYSSSRGAIDFARAVVEQTSAATRLPLRTKPLMPSNVNRHGRLGILDDTIPRACLIEAGFVTNEFDAALIKDSNLDNAFAQGIHKGIRVFLALPAEAGPVTPPSFFLDIPQDAWYKDDVALCLREGLFTMSGDGRFHPERPVTRAEVAAVMARHLHAHHGIS